MRRWPRAGGLARRGIRVARRDGGRARANSRIDGIKEEQADEAFRRLAGQRLGEILALEWRDIELTSRRLSVQGSDWVGHVSAEGRTVARTSERAPASVRGLGRTVARTRERAPASEPRERSE